MAFDYLGAGAGGAAPPTAGQPWYTPEDINTFQSWAGGRYGRQATPDELAQIGANSTDMASAQTYADTLATQQGWNGTPANGGAAPTPFFPEFTPPEYQQGPAFQAPQPFRYDSFRAPTMADAEADPGYQFALKQGMGALQGAQAARGLARTGGALKGLMDYGQQAAAQQYGNVYDRAARQWGMNRENEAQAYATNYQTGRDAWDRNEDARRQGYDRQYRGASDAFNARFRGRELQFDDLYRRWNTNVNVNAQMALAD